MRAWRELAERLRLLAALVLADTASRIVGDLGAGGRELINEGAGAIELELGRRAGER